MLYLDSREKGSLLSDSTRAALETLATEAAVAIENARLYRETMEKARMEQEMRIAAEIQQALLPKAGRSGAFFRAAAASLPCRSIGGDFYDYVDLLDGVVRVRARRRRGQGAAGGAPERDDAGHVRGAGGRQRLAVADDRAREPGALPARHRVAVRDADVRVAARRRPADLLQRRPQPAARRRQERRSGGSKCGGPIVGLFESATFEEETVTLAPGDWLIVFSDGVSEALSATGDEYGESRILAVVRAQPRRSSPQKLLEALFADVRDVRQGRGAERRHHGDGAALSAS